MTLEITDPNSCYIKPPNFIVGFGNPIGLSHMTSKYGNFRPEAQDSIYGISCFGASDGWIEIVDGTGNGEFQTWNYDWEYPDGSYGDLLYI